MIYLKVHQIFVNSYAIAKRYKEVGVNVHVTMNSTKMKQLHGSCLWIRKDLVDKNTTRANELCTLKFTVYILHS